MRRGEENHRLGERELFRQSVVTHIPSFASHTPCLFCCVHVFSFLDTIIMNVCCV